MALQMAPRRSGMRVLDMGCGSGIIGITLALELARPAPEVVMADISDKNLRHEKKEFCITVSKCPASRHTGVRVCRTTHLLGCSDRHE